MRTLTRMLCGLCTVLLGAVAGCSGGPVQDQPRTVVAHFDNGAGLYVGNAVSVLGMQVGEVSQIRPHGAYIEVTMMINDDSVQIPADATAVTLSTSVLTDRHVEFTPAYQGGDTLPDGAQLGLERTRVPVGIDRLLSSSKNMSTELEGDGQGNGPIAHLLDVASQISDGSGPEMRATLDELSNALRLSEDRGAGTRDTIIQIVDQLSSLMRAAATNDQIITDFGVAARQLGDVLASLEIGTGSTGAQANQLMRQAKDVLTTNRDALHGTVGDMDVVTKALADYRNELAEFIDVTPMLLANGYNSVDPGNRGFRVRALMDKIFFDGQMVKEVCNILGLRQLGCSTGTLQDFGPDFGLTDMLDAMARLPK